MTTAKPSTYYLIAWLVGSIVTAVFLILICNHYNFDNKSSICVYAYGFFGFFIKGMIFFLPYLILFRDVRKNSILLNAILIWLPFTLFMLWYFMIIQFQIESLYADIEFGYISRFPHFIIQLLTSFGACAATTIVVIRKRKLHSSPE
jgi:hypothetical protein